MKETKTHVKPVIHITSAPSPLPTAHDRHRSTRVQQRLFLDFFKRIPFHTWTLVSTLKMIPLCEKHSYFGLHGTPTPGSASYQQDRPRIFGSTQMMESRQVFIARLPRQAPKHNNNRAIRRKISVSLANECDPNHQRMP